MSSGKSSLLIASLLSLSLGAFMFFLVLTLMPLDSSRGYAVLTVDASYPDRLIGDLLAAEVVHSTQRCISESTQWVFLDDFGTLQRIPLDGYRDRVEPFDPRDDGYADKLRAFFVREGKRLFFIPFSGDARISDPWLNKPRIATLEASITGALGSIPFSLTFLGFEKPLLFYFLLFVGAAGITMGFSREPILILALLPILSSLVFAGPPGLALCAALAVLVCMAAEPLRNHWAAHRYGQDQGRYPVKNYSKLYPGLVPLAAVLLFLGVFGILYSISGSTGNMPAGKNLAKAGIAAFICSGTMLLLVIWIEASQGKAQDHVRFMPVWIIETGKWGRINRTIIPFALVSLVALYGPLYEGLYTYHDPGFIADPQYFVAERVYENHAAYQASFSLLPLGGMDPTHPDRDETVPELDYRQYCLGEDGLIAGTSGYEQTLSLRHYDDQRIPPFPLEDLIAFLEGFRHTEGGNPSHMRILTIISFNMIGFALLLMASGLYSTVLSWFKQAGKKKNSLVYNEKRIAA
jgi:disulfide bond formation protein DsbB